MKKTLSLDKGDVISEHKGLVEKLTRLGKKYNVPSLLAEARKQAKELKGYKKMKKSPKKTKKAKR